MVSEELINIILNICEKHLRESNMMNYNIQCDESNNPPDSDKILIEIMYTRSSIDFTNVLPIHINKNDNKIDLPDIQIIPFHKMFIEIESVVKIIKRNNAIDEIFLDNE